MGHLERKLREKEATRQKILDAALRIATEEGWSLLTIRKIAKAVEYTPPIVYEYFKNKEDLLHEIVKNGFRELHTEFEEERKTETDPRSLLMKLSLIHWEFAFKNAELYQLMFSLERPVHDEEALVRFFTIKELFEKLSGKSEPEVLEIIFNWLCLVNGTISAFMKLKLPPKEYAHKAREPREIFISFIERFIQSILVE